MEKSMAQSLSPKQETPTSKASSGNSPRKPETQGPYLSSEIRSGFFVLASAAVFIALLFFSGQTQFMGQSQTYALHFNYVAGLMESSPVHLAGHKVGKVSKIEFLGGDQTTILVEVSLRKDVTLRQDSEAFIDSMGFMGEKFVELTSGTPEAGRLESGATLQGTDPIPMMEMVKKGTEIIEQFERSGKAMEGLMADLKEVVGENKDELDETIGNVNAMSANLKDMTHDLKLHPWKLLRKGKEQKIEKEKEEEPAEKKKGWFKRG
jgi:phospholipid/cholesterol/gamma-HCH transport system substrate-binding protein